MNNFKENTTTSITNNGVEISCKKGLWSVSGSHYLQVKAEAMYYFQQYVADGEYDGTAHEKFIETIRRDK